MTRTGEEGPTPAGKYVWAGIALLAGLRLITYASRVSADLLPLALTGCLVAGLALRLRTGPILFFGVWIAGELRRQFAGLARLKWPGWEQVSTGSVEEVVVVSVVYLFAAAHYQFLSAGVDPGRKDPFAMTLPSPSFAAGLAATGASLALRVAAVALLAAGLGLAADALAETRLHWRFGSIEKVQPAAFFALAVGAFLVVAWIADLVRFAFLDRTTATCYVYDLIWARHRDVWGLIDRRLPKDRREPEGGDA